MIKAVLFDLDGTLANSIEDLADSTNKALKAMGFPGHTVGEYKYFVGDGIPKLIERALPENRRDKETKDACLELFMADYRVHYHDKTNAYDGVREMLSELKSDGLNWRLFQIRRRKWRKRWQQSFSAICSTLWPASARATKQSPTPR